jgi:lipopolysaccharide heptosyltransferase II
MRALNKILIIRFSSIGDIVLASSLIRALRMSYPDALIDFLVKSEYAELVRFNPHLSSVITLRTSKMEELTDLRRRIGSERYDAIFDIHNSLRSRFLRLFSGAKHVSVVNKRVLPRFVLVKFKRNLYNEVLSVANRYLETAAMYGVHDDGKGLEIFIPDDTASAVLAIMGKYNLTRYERVVGFAPAAKHYTKRWLPERFVELGIKLAKQERAKILVFGGKNDSDFCGDIAQLINSDLDSSAAESLAGKFSLLEIAAALDYCHVVVSNDTGVMHLAAARKRNVVAIFGSTVREFGFFPYKTKNLVIEQEGLPCRPCSHIGLAQCPKGHFKCMRDINVDRVLSATRELFEPPIENKRS